MLQVALSRFLLRAAAVAACAATLLPAAAQAQPWQPGQVLRDCSGCPQMVVLPAGRFRMGADAAQRAGFDVPAEQAANEEPVHEVRIERPIAVGRFPVTREEWARYMVESAAASGSARAPAGSGAATGCAVLDPSTNVWARDPQRSWRDPGFRQSAREPVVCISWPEAQAYVAWLSERSGQRYRLLSEAEWEYAARAGSTGSNHWGDGPDGVCEHANASDQSRLEQHAAARAQPAGSFACRDGFVTTAPVDAFGANAFGLYGMSGNVWQWVDDCWSDSHAGAPSDGAPRRDGDCRYRVDRGGSWVNSPRYLRAAARHKDLLDARTSVLGLRVARELPATSAATSTAASATPATTPPPAAADKAPPGGWPSACKALVGHDFSGTPDAPSLVVSAVIVPQGDELPAHCLVNGQIAPTIGYRMWLPLADWNGKFAQAGCGGRCGWILDEGCQIVLMRGYACLAADLGHKGTMYDNLWAIDNVPGEIDFGFRATHVANLTGKVVLQQFYGRPARWSYYIGASTGGRQGLVEAQRFPHDFDGIVAGEPAMGTPGAAQPEVGPRLVDAVNALSPKGVPLLSPAAILQLHARVVERCDLDDGLKDGIISDPRRCDFAPGQLLCPATGSDFCLSPDQAQAVAGVYAAGALPGSEKAWIGAYVQPDGSLGRYGRRWANPYRYPYAWVFNDATNPDLRAFKAAGGKLILYQGWADEATFPMNPVRYYETVERLMGGRAATQDFFRLFMIPGQSHIPGNGGAETVDYLAALEAWVERGVPPDVLLAQKLRSFARFAGPVTFPVYLRPDNVEFERPLYPYPVQARYRGQGDPKQAQSFGPHAPPPAAAP